MIAATPRQIAVAEAIEKKAIHIMPSSIAAPASPSKRTRRKPADNAAAGLRFLMEPKFPARNLSCTQHKCRSLNAAFRRVFRNKSNGDRISFKLNVERLLHVLDLSRPAAERTLRQHRGHERIEVTVEHIGWRWLRFIGVQIFHHLIRLQDVGTDLV